LEKRKWPGGVKGKKESKGSGRVVWGDRVFWVCPKTGGSNKKRKEVSRYFCKRGSLG